ncbi:hypothetical protein [Streptomyces atratus]|uniref:hypothetical protein n=1 Tax=Streptomyces atratus TaxID=1893 RepID=UPI002256EE9C|nr:hypothetical protein [Streptomyces atratus]MCX5345907.1 hypothetical protein [Streptomyces atratus]
MSAVAASAALMEHQLSEVVDMSVDGAVARMPRSGRQQSAPVRVRTQRVRVPMRLVWSPFYADVALTAYVKVKALASRPEGCQARTATIASYLGLSVASAERGMAQLRRPGPDGVVELRSQRRTHSGGTGESAVRTVRPMNPAEAFVWVPVAAAEDLTPRQLRAYALIAYAQARGIALTEAELASGLRHYSGKKAGQALTVTAASAVVDEVEAVRWVTVQRRVGAQGRNLYIAHDIAPKARPAGACPVAGGSPETAVDSGSEGVSSSQVGEGSGSPVDEGSLAYKESPRTDSPDDEGALSSPAVGEVPVGKGARPVENPVGGEPTRTAAGGGLALRADGKTQPSSSKPKDEKRSSGGELARSAYTGPQLAMSPEIYAVLEPVHWLLTRVNNPFVERKIAREVGRQLAAGIDAERLHQRLTARFAKVMTSEIRDPGRWLLGVALPRWGCGYQDCESGVIWRTGTACEVCAEIVQDKAAARQRAQRIAQGLCPEHGTRPGPSGLCGDCELDDAIDQPAPIPVQRVPEGPPRGVCGDCGARIMLTGPALDDGLCKPCRTESAALAADDAPTLPTTTAAAAEQPICSGRDGLVPCTREALPARSVCLRHRVQELAGEVA